MLANEATRTTSAKDLRGAPSLADLQALEARAMTDTLGTTLGATADPFRVAFRDRALQLFAADRVGAKASPSVQTAPAARPPVRHAGPLRVTSFDAV